MLGGIWFENNGQNWCFLRGYLSVRLYGGAGELAVEVQHLGTIGADGALTGPVVTAPQLLPPNEPKAVFVALRWWNWCGAWKGPNVSVDVTVDGVQTSVPSTGDPWEITTCINPGGGSLLEEGPVQQPVGGPS